MVRVRMQLCISLVVYLEMLLVPLSTVFDGVWVFKYLLASSQPKFES